MCEMREGVYTQLARSINKFSEHKLNKVELYNECVGLIEMADEIEKADRLQIEKFLDEHKELMSTRDIPYSNWKDGLNMLEK